jgi:hypothetical protein
MAAASSTPIRRTLREPDATVQLHADAGDLPDPGRPVLRVRPHGRRPAPGLGGAGRDDAASSLSDTVVVSRRAGAHPRCRRWVSTRRHRAASGGNMEGKETRFGISASALFAAVTTAASCGAVNAMHDSLHAAGRRRADAADAVRRGDFRRRRLGPVRHAGLRHHGGVHRRPDDRPHAGISRQEDPGLRNEDDVDRHPGHAVLVLVGTAIAACADAVGQGRHRQPGGARLLRDPVRLQFGGQQQRQRVCRPVRQYAVL